VTWFCVGVFAGCQNRNELEELDVALVALTLKSRKMHSQLVDPSDHTGVPGGWDFRES